MEMSDAGNAYLSLGLMASSVPWPKYFRYCVSCVECDRATVRETYWHRLHQIPGIEVCALHGERLLNSNVEFRQHRNRYEYSSAESSVVLASHCVGNDSKNRGGCTDPEVQLAKSAAWLLDHPRAFRSGVELRDRFVWELAVRGFATWNGTIRASRLLTNVLSRYPVKWLETIGCALAAAPHENWLERLFRRPESTQTPLRYLLLVDLLGATVEEILCKETPHPFGSAPWPCLNRAATHFGQLTVPQCEVSPTRYGTALSGRFPCPQCGMVYVRLGPDTTISNLDKLERATEERLRRNWVPVYGHVWDQTLVALWSDEHISLRMLSQRLGVDIRTVRLQALRLGLNPVRAAARSQMTSVPTSIAAPPANTMDLGKYRSEWLQLQRDHPAYGRTSLRKAAPGIHAFLYRHDRLWLEEHSPFAVNSNVVRPRVDWKVRDVALSSKVSLAANRLLNQKPLVRLTRTAMLREAGSTWALTKLSRLKLTKSTLEHLEEDRAQFAVRRIQAVLSTESASGLSLPKWRLIRMANIRRDVLALKPVEIAIGRAFPPPAR
jgi:hypothetical protein